MPAWETATDWDSAQSESGVVHESVTNTDHNDATIVKRGYSVADPLYTGDLVGYWPLQEDSGSTAYDFSGNNNDGTINGATVNDRGILGTSGYLFDGTNPDSVSIPQAPNVGGSNNRTIVGWVNFNDASTKQTFFNLGPNTTGNRFTCTTAVDTSTRATPRCEISGGGDNFDNFNIYQDTWTHIAFVLNGTTLDDVIFYKFGNSQSGTSTNTIDTDNTTDVAIGDLPSKADYGFDGQIVDLRVYDRALSASEIQTLYEVGDTPGTLTTNKKQL